MQGTVLGLILSDCLTVTCWYHQGDHSPGKPGKVMEFESGQGKWKKSGKSQGK